MAGIEGPLWNLRRDLSRDPKREPGPINLQRLCGIARVRWNRHLHGLPLALTPEDIRAGKVEVAVVGAPVDTSLGHCGAQYGPRYMRADERSLLYRPAILQKSRHTHQTVRGAHGRRLRRHCRGQSRSQSVMRRSPQRGQGNRWRGAFPVVRGGDHTSLWPDAAAVADVYGPGNVGVVHFDCYVDCANSVMGHKIAHGTPIRRLLEDEHVPARNFVQVGLHSFVVPTMNSSAGC